ILGFYSSVLSWPCKSPSWILYKALVDQQTHLPYWPEIITGPEHLMVKRGNPIIFFGRLSSIIPSTNGCIQYLGSPFPTFQIPIPLSFESQFDHAFALDDFPQPL